MSNKMKFRDLMVIASIYLILSVLSSCQNNSKYIGDWIVTEVKYNETDILDSFISRNLKISDNTGGSTPISSHELFNDVKIKTKSSCKIKTENGIDSVIFDDSLFFTDRFRISCFSDDCCEILLQNDSKLVKCIFNSELSPSEKRRDCPFLDSSTFKF